MWGAGRTMCEGWWERRGEELINSGCEVSEMPSPMLAVEDIFSVLVLY